MTTQNNLGALLKADNGFLSSLELPEIQVYLNYHTGPNVGYTVIKDGSVLFSGADFKPSPLDRMDSIAPIIGLLGFLTCQPGDTDSEYFDKYTAAQMEWANSFECEQLKGLVGDFDNTSEPEYQEKAIEYFTQYFNL